MEQQKYRKRDTSNISASNLLMVVVFPYITTNFESLAAAMEGLDLYHKHFMCLKCHQYTNYK